MAKHIIKDVMLTISGQELSDHCKSVNLTITNSAQDDTVMGDDWEEVIAGLSAWELSGDLEQDFAASSVNATLFALVGAPEFAILVRPTSAAKSATNPDFSGNGILTQYDAIKGTVGDKHIISFTIKGTGPLTLVTS